MGIHPILIMVNKGGLQVWYNNDKKQRSKVEGLVDNTYTASRSTLFAMLICLALPLFVAWGTPNPFLMDWRVLVGVFLCSLLGMVIMGADLGLVPPIPGLDQLPLSCVKQAEPIMKLLFLVDTWATYNDVCNYFMWAEVFVVLVSFQLELAGSVVFLAMGVALGATLLQAVDCVYFDEYASDNEWWAHTLTRCLIEVVVFFGYDTLQKEYDTLQESEAVRQEVQSTFSKTDELWDSLPKNMTREEADSLSACLENDYQVMEKWNELWPSKTKSQIPPSTLLGALALMLCVLGCYHVHILHTQGYVTGYTPLFAYERLSCERVCHGKPPSDCNIFARVQNYNMVKVDKPTLVANIEAINGNKAAAEEVSAMYKEHDTAMKKALVNIGSNIKDLCDRIETDNSAEEQCTSLKLQHADLRDLYHKNMTLEAAKLKLRHFSNFVLAYKASKEALHQNVEAFTTDVVTQYVHDQTGTDIVHIVGAAVVMKLAPLILPAFVTNAVSSVVPSFMWGSESATKTQVVVKLAADNAAAPAAGALASINMYNILTWSLLPAGLSGLGWFLPEGMVSYYFIASVNMGKNLVQGVPGAYDMSLWDRAAAVAGRAWQLAFAAQLRGKTTKLLSAYKCNLEKGYRNFAKYTHILLERCKDYPNATVCKDFEKHGLKEPLDDTQICGSADALGKDLERSFLDQTANYHRLGELVAKLMWEPLESSVRDAAVTN